MKSNLEKYIKNIEEERGSKVIVYCTGNKKPVQDFGAVIASDTLPFFNTILEKIGRVKKITLALNSDGGQLEAPWPIVNLIREYCDIFEVIVIEKALSAGTLITLGADKIIMSPYSQLSPIDPAAEFTDSKSNKRKRIEIEDIIGYIDFAKEKIGIAEQSSLIETMKELTKEIEPTMLGSVNRTHSLIRKLSKKLLYLHKNRLTEKQIDEITEHLTQKLYSHKHLINRKEAKEVIGFGNIIEYANPKIKENIDSLSKYYVNLFEIEKDFDPFALLGENQKKEYKLTRASVHSLEIKYNFNSTYQLEKIPDPSGNIQVRVGAIKNKWELK